MAKSYKEEITNLIEKNGVFLEDNVEIVIRLKNLYKVIFFSFSFILFLNKFFQLATRCLLQATVLESAKEEPWKDLGFLLYQQHKLVLINTTKQNTTQSDASNDNNSVTTINNDTNNTSKEDIYELSADYFRRAAEINPKEWQYLYFYVVETFYY